MEKAEGLKIVYMGTPGFAVGPLSAILNSGVARVLAVVTAPDKPAGRGLKLQPSEVKQLAVARQLPVLQPEKLKDPGFLDQLRALDADLFVVVAFRMLPEVVWNMPRLGTINLHASLLPAYRGAAPINWAIINGEETTGVTTFFLKHEIDTGDVLMQQEIAIAENTTAGELHDQLMEEGSRLLVASLAAISSGSATRIPQDSIPAHTNDWPHAPKLNRENTRINWTQSAHQIVNLVRGLSPYPSAWCVMEENPGEEVQFRVFSARECFDDLRLDSGECLVSGKKLLCGTGNGIVELLTVQKQGKARMDARDFVNGLRSDTFHLR
jgi:methionyl-tRNA formyltransferase